MKLLVFSLCLGKTKNINSSLKIIIYLKSVCKMSYLEICFCNYKADNNNGKMYKKEAMFANIFKCTR